MEYLPIEIEISIVQLLEGTFLLYGVAISLMFILQAS